MIQSVILHDWPGHVRHQVAQALLPVLERFVAEIPAAERQHVKG